MRKKPIVLVVDDNRDVLDILEVKISAMGFRVASASSAVEALGYLAQSLEPAVIVSDIQMPILSGIEFAQMLRDRRSTIPLILMSGETTFAQSELATLKVHSFLPKPIDFNLLKSCLVDASENIVAYRLREA